MFKTPLNLYSQTYLSFE